MNYKEWVTSVGGAISRETVLKMFGEDVEIMDVPNLIAFCLYKLSKLEPERASQAVIDVEPVSLDEQPQDQTVS